MIPDRAEKALEEIRRREFVGPVTATVLHSLFATIEGLEAKCVELEAQQKAHESFLWQRDLEAAAPMDVPEMMPVTEEEYR